jgi:hypothetical protein
MGVEVGLDLSLRPQRYSVVLRPSVESLLFEQLL